MLIFRELLIIFHENAKKMLFRLVETKNSTTFAPAFERMAG